MKKILIALLFSLFALNAYAHNCAGEFQPETGNCRIIGPDGRQIIYNSDPPQSGSNVPKKIIRHRTVNVPSKYGALALNERTGISGGALDMNSKAEAKREAIKRCENGGINAPCKMVVWVENGCIAGAKGRLGKFSRAFYSSGKPSQVERIALNMCKNAGIKKCEIFIPEACSVPDGMYN